MSGRALLNRAQAAEYLGLQVSTLRRWYYEGRGPQAVKSGTHRQSRIYYPRGELDRWIADPRAYDRPSRPAGLDKFDPPPREPRG